jgi:signal peptidase I
MTAQVLTLRRHPPLRRAPDYEGVAGSTARVAGRRRAHLGLAAVSALVLLAIGWAGAWRVQGGQWLVVASPSMGTSAPVGTLLWVEPASLDELRAGDLVTFHPPTSPHQTITHRVVRTTGGNVTTKGDINASNDPWRLDEGDLVGRVEGRWWHVGWLIRAMPLLAVGGILLGVLLRWFTAPRWRVPLLLMGVAALLSLSIYVLKPLVRADAVSIRSVPQGGEATFVSTGLLPIRVEADNGAHVDLLAGEVGTVTATTPTHAGRYEVHVGPHVPVWWWITGAGLVMMPALWTLVVGLPGRRDDEEGSGGGR